MTEEHKLLAIGSEITNRHGDVGHQLEISDDVMFLFTSESVGEGHPGKFDLKLFLSNGWIMQMYFTCHVVCLRCTCLQFFM